MPSPHQHWTTNTSVLKNSLLLTGLQRTVVFFKALILTRNMVLLVAKKILMPKCCEGTNFQNQKQALEAPSPSLVIKARGRPLTWLVSETVLSCQTDGWLSSCSPNSKILSHRLFHNMLPKDEIYDITETPKVLSKPQVCSEIMQTNRSSAGKRKRGTESIQTALCNNLQVTKCAQRDFAPHLNIWFWLSLDPFIVFHASCYILNLSIILSKIVVC